MIKPLRQLNVTYDGQNIRIEHDQQSELIVHTKPEGLSYRHEMRKVTNAVSVHQDIQMMDFQAKIAMLFRVNMRALSLPLKGKFEIEITILSTRQLKEIPLLKVMKSAVDGLNKAIISNDNAVYSCSIRYVEQKVNSKTPFTKPQDILTMRLFECKGTKRNLVGEIESIRVNVAPKTEALHLNFDEEFWTFDDEFVEAIGDPLLKDGFLVLPAGSTCRLQMTFTGDVKDTDLDNMANLYMEVLRKIGLEDHHVEEFSLRKQQSNDNKITVFMQ